MTDRLKIGIVAPSSKIPKIELRLGVQKIREEGFQVDVHTQCNREHLFFAGTDEERAGAFFEYAANPSYFALWCARGGHGAIRVLPLLEKLTEERGVPPKKLLIGYSDVTALMEFVQKRWGWSILHAPMPSMRKFSILPKSDWKALSHLIRGQSEMPPLKKLKFWANPPSEDLTAKMVGGNLTVWNCLLGTPFQANADNCILFLEDVDEGLYRVDRMVQQLLISKSLSKVRAILLGNFLNCLDRPPSILKVKPNSRNVNRLLTHAKPNELQPLRKPMKELKALKAIFSELGATLGIPVAYGLPVGHGPEVSPLPLNATYQLTPDGALYLKNWDWVASSDSLK